MSDTTTHSKDNSRDDELRKRRISREIVRIDSEEDVEGVEEDVEGVEEEAAEDVTEAEDDAEVSAEEQQQGASKSLWRHIVTGGFIASDGAVQYYRYLIAIAVMCFVSIFLTFMSLNANAEYRRKERQRDELRERSISFREQRLRISQREEVMRLISDKDGVTMVDQNNSVRM